MKTNSLFMKELKKNIVIEKCDVYILNVQETSLLYVGVLNKACKSLQ